MMFLRILLLVLSSNLYAEEECPSDPISIYLSWQEDPSTSIVIKWITPLNSTKTHLHVKESETGSWKSLEGALYPFPNEEPYALHSVSLQNLLPKTTYSFHVEGEETNHLFTTLPKSLADPLTCVIGGDINLSNTAFYRETTLQAAQHDPAFIIIGGDLACPSAKKNAHETPQKWLSLLKIWYEAARHHDRLIPLVPVIGNHDIRGGYGKPLENAPYFAFLFLNGQKKSFSTLRLEGQASFYLLDSGHASPPSGDQAEWLAEELQKDVEVLHRIAVYHVPAYPPVRSYINLHSRSVRNAWPALFDRFRLHLAFENHDHAYKRTYPLTNNQPTPRGVVYIGNGSWGVKPRAPKTASQTLYLEKTSQTRGFCLLRLSEEKREVFVIGFNGELIDSFSQPTDKIAAKEAWLKAFTVWRKRPPQ